MFDLGLVQDEWKLYVKRPLDRERAELYVVNVTASDGLFACETAVAVTVTDANDNAPVFVQVRPGPVEEAGSVDPEVLIRLFFLCPCSLPTLTASQRTLQWTACC